MQQLDLCRRLLIFIASMEEWLIIERKVQSYRRVIISASPLLANRTEGCGLGGAAEHGGFGCASLVPAVPGSHASLRAGLRCSALGWGGGTSQGGRHLPDHLIFTGCWAALSCFWLTGAPSHWAMFLYSLVGLLGKSNLVLLLLLIARISHNTCLIASSNIHYITQLHSNIP